MTQRPAGEQAPTEPDTEMPYLNVQGLHPKTGAPFAAMLDDGHSRIGLPVTAELVSQHWLKIGADDWRQVLSCRFESGVVSYGITPSRLGVAERQRARKVSEAVAAGRALRSALEKLDTGDKGRARMLERQLARWIEIATNLPPDSQQRPG